MTMKKKVSKTKERVTQVFNQARESLKLFEALEKETLAKAKTFVKIPMAANRKRLTNDKILSSLRKLGVASLSEVKELQNRIEKLEEQITLLNQQVSVSGRGGNFIRESVSPAEAVPRG